MVKRRNIIISQFDYKKSIGSVYQALTSSLYSDDKGYGFKDVEQDEDVIFTTIIKRTPTFINYFNIKEGIFEKQQIYVFSEFSLIIDFRLHTLYLNGSSTLLSFIKSILKIVIGESFTITSADFTAYDLYEIIRRKKIKSKLEEISITSFAFDDGVIGKFSGKVIKQQVALALIKQYKHDVSKITCRIYANEEDFAIQLSNSGCIAILCEEDDFRECLFYLTSIIYN